ncbi:helix-turn-helix and ligand-binding sensor domain-containing protein [Flavobacterium capsici]|uniref:Triple tyrosine motif-containing protein n=1 Tax=Flavobacterium capsici TaxID=3075618 RepID=A0AA96J2C0_9FLAO|nr:MULTISPECIES: triple tyrosine motif-containing protein [unclassified Flavobacterium]WNM18073.1 triple tyrosine motif-containing protein [Flavobacterium sp. PMR2A8]WNM22125.1 triple tyrosine motif-containing protein [Flavobacterium sp. PMTSA4]
MIYYLTAMNKISFYFFTLFFLAFSSFSQDLPPIVKFKSNVYGAGNQNWMVSEDENQFVYFANNEGLLEYNGSNWKLYPSPNETIIRSVKVIGSRIYTGCYMEFGYWERNSEGLLQYVSLSSKIKDKLIEDEHFWNILEADNWILFQSFNRIYVYDLKKKTFQFIDNHPYIFRIYKIDNSIYFQAVGEGLYEVVNGQSLLVNDDERIKTNRIVEIFENQDGLLLQTERAGIFQLKEGKLQPYHFVSEDELRPNSIFCAKKLSNGGFALGTISNGVYILDKAGKTEYHIKQNSGLSNNTILSLEEDSANNLWLGLDNGIDCINIQSPAKSYLDDEGYLGTVYASIKFKDNIYLGTNQGLFYKEVNSKGKFQLVNGTKGQVWALFEHDNTLFCGHDLGTFIIEGTSPQLIFKGTGTWKFNNYPGNSNIILQGNYNGLSVLEKNNSEWKFRNKIEAFDISSRYFEIEDKTKKIYIGHEYKGIIEVDLNESLRKANSFKIVENPKKGKHISLAKYNGTIFFAGKQGIFKLNPTKDIFVKDKNLSAVFDNDEYISGKINVDKSNKMWVFTRNYIYYFTSGNFNSELKKHKISIPFAITNPMIGYENITQISNNEYLVGKTDGYFIINLNNFKVQTHKVYLTSVSVNSLENPVKSLKISEESELNYDENNLTFDFTVPQYNRFIDVEYQYILEGFQNKWSEWSGKSTVNFKNLPPGTYKFMVKAKIANDIQDNIIVYNFTINKPWYLTNLAVIIYLFLFIICAYYINKSYQNYYQKQKEKLIEENNLLLEISALENEQQLMKLRNEQLTQDMDAKNRELAVSTMSLIKKNELLEIIKEDLKKSAEVSSNRSLKTVISTINRNISNDDSWNKFKEAFDNADKDFLKKIKNAHPSLTPSDLKLCAYLRMNLSSKEIAPMLNISIRSVEIKRYRLRKKLNLTHDDGLVNYILSI